MRGRGYRLGCVLAVQGISTPVSVARKLMEHGQHTVLAGEGAKTFALENGFKEENILTDESRREFELWKREQNFTVDKEASHDTIGIICRDETGELVVATSTSGWKFKLPGRVGDSPLVGSGFYVDQACGAAVATGDGEEIMRGCLSFLVVERMRMGDSPTRACEHAIARLRSKKEFLSGASFQGENRQHKKLTVGIVAMNTNGDVGASSTLGPANIHRGKPAFPCIVWKQVGARVGGESMTFICRGEA
ncbi:hypothetical protein GUITHDRAFT_77590 [Guillardia theta CCMP2712]|uniref:Uncharacterized protein n=1 Tax=Guillardia theta (strain CCMP2712) TaxID=905079 RepID=L1INR1_GUITC|nr:hypothetical protein GUITHDRAFT_77590 [Guillardia theta CCMP2712]EKX37926.1 hypothetical protein GUITHDRAFT_77590 [Guillardia theta CCMP2712]|eukprot:XP_005824906.1 hypothetical protein GUITHDRAFT_77590 [Guillardia theta CCMP2712]